MHRGQTVIALQKQLNLLDHIPVGECVLRRDGTVLFWNACLENWTALSRAQIVGRKIDHYFSHLSQPRYVRRLRETFDGGFTVIFSSQIHPHLIPCSGVNGQLRVQHTIVTAIPAADGIGFDALLSIQDVTDLTQQIQNYKQIQDRAWIEVKQRQTTEEQLHHERELLNLRYEQERLVDRIVQHMRQSLNLREILQTAVTEIQTLLRADRVLVYRFTSTDGRGRIAAESCHPDFPSLLRWTQQNTPSELQDDGAQEYKPLDNLDSHAQIQAITDITQSDLALADVQFLQSFSIQAQLAIPVLLGNGVGLSQGSTSNGPALWGWLIVHQCRSVRQWQPEEIDWLKRLESQLAVAIHQSELLKQVHSLNINLERQVHAQTLELQQALTLESTLKRITDKVRDSLDEDQILQTVVTELGEALEVYHCDTTLYSAGPRTFSLQHKYVRSDRLPVECDHHLHVEELFEIYDRLFQGQCVAFCQLQWHKTNCHSAILTCPVLDDRGVLGDFWLFRSATSSFSDLEIRLVQQVANQCAIAIRQAQLYKASQQKIEELARLNHLKDDFLNTISHELRTPLVSIRMLLQTLELLLNGSGSLQEKVTQANQYFHILEDECQREAKLIDDLLNLTRLEVGTEPIVCVPVNLEIWLPYIAESFEERMQQQQQYLRLELPEGLPPLLTDITILERILTELLNNAYKYTPAGGTITVLAEVVQLEELKRQSDQKSQALNTEIGSKLIVSQILTSTFPQLKQPQKHCIRISVSNTGAEIPVSELNCVFNKFYRIPDTDIWNHGGTGLGLSLVKRMTEYLGGNIQAKSENNVTQFTLDLAIDP